MPRKSKVFQSRGINKTARNVRSERDYGMATLVDHSGQMNRVTMMWGGMNDLARANQIFELRIGDEKALISWEEMLRYGRWV